MTLSDLRTPKTYVETFLKIRDKCGKITALRLKPAQQRLYDVMKREHDAGRPVRIVVLKARQLGFSTAIEAFFFQDAATRELVRTLIVAHDAESTANLFGMNKLFYDKLPPQLKPLRRASNAQEIVFENPTRNAEEKQRRPGLMSSIRCVPATGASVGRGATLTNVHASEAAFWRDMDETLDALLQAVPDDPNTAVVIETTPNGFNSFKTFWDATVAGKTKFVPLFFPWFEDPGYRKPVPPGTEWTEEEEILRKTYALDDEQLAWRRWCISANLRGDAEKFKQEYPSCPEEAFLLSGDPYFDVNKLMPLSTLAPDPIMIGRFSFVPDDNLKPCQTSFEGSARGEIYIYELPEKLTPYVLGSDVAGDGSDRFATFVMNNVTGEQVAELIYSGGSEIWFAQQLYCLGMYYNVGLIGVEINFSTYPERKLEEWGYPKLYIRERSDDVSHELTPRKLGWRTDSLTRPNMLANLQTLVSECPETIKSKKLVSEMLTFVRNSDMRPEAAPGAHDDLVMAAAIAHKIRGQQSYLPFEERIEAAPKLITQLRKKR